MTPQAAGAARVPMVSKLEVIRVDNVIGDGSEDDPFRMVADYFNEDGEHLFRIDPQDTP